MRPAGHLKGRGITDIKVQAKLNPRNNKHKSYFEMIKKKKHNQYFKDNVDCDEFTITSKNRHNPSMKNNPNRITSREIRKRSIVSRLISTIAGPE